MTADPVRERLAEITARADAATWDEEWRPIPDVPNYDVSNFGHVRSHLRRGNHKDKVANRPRRLSASTNPAGYLSVALPGPTGNYSTRRVHSLVAMAFHGPCPEGNEVAHLNGNKLDNRAENLAYVSHVENESHKRLHGTHGAGERNSQAVLLGWEVAEIKFLADKGIPQGRIAALFQIDQRHVSDIVRGRKWQEQPARSDVPALVAFATAVLDALDQIDSGDHATAGRDYGRGAAHASRLVREAVTRELGVQS